jgi:8-amino-7-oxononanoate synthase
VPAALAESHAARQLARRLALLIGGERALLMTSTLHLFFDLFRNALPRPSFFYDEALYPVARWGLEHAAISGGPSWPMPHMACGIDLGWLRQRTALGSRPVIVSDGFCAGCGRPAPLRRYAQWAERTGGYLVIDDTQALGLFGANPSREHPFGCGGGGSLRHQHLRGSRVIIGASLAKALGVPLAVVSGPECVMSTLAAESDIRVHTSPPSAPLIAAGQSALRQSLCRGGELRRSLAQRIRAFRDGVAQLGLHSAGGLFPVQSLPLPDAPRLQRELAARGVHALVTQPSCARGTALTFILRADHKELQLSAALRTLRECLQPEQARRRS